MPWVDGKWQQDATDQAGPVAPPQASSGAYGDPNYRPMQGGVYENNMYPGEGGLHYNDTGQQWTPGSEWARKRVQLADAQGGTQAPPIDWTRANQGAANLESDSATSQYQLAQQRNTMQGLLAAAQGKGPSYGTQQLYASANQAAQGRNAFAASQNRTGLARIAAGRQAQLQSESAASTLPAQAQAIRAGEMASARDQYLQAANQYAGGAQALRGLYQTGEQLGMQRGQLGSDLEMRQRALNAEREGAYLRGEVGAMNASTGGAVQQIGIQGAMNREDAQFGRAITGGIMEAGASGLGRVSDSAIRAGEEYDKNHPPDDTSSSDERKKSDIVKAADRAADETVQKLAAKREAAPDYGGLGYGGISQGGTKSTPYGAALLAAARAPAPGGPSSPAYTAALLRKYGLMDEAPPDTGLGSQITDEAGRPVGDVQYWTPEDVNKLRKGGRTMPAMAETAPIDIEGDAGDTIGGGRTVTTDEGGRIINLKTGKPTNQYYFPPQKDEVVPGEPEVNEQSYKNAVDAANLADKFRDNRARLRPVEEKPSTMANLLAAARKYIPSDVRGKANVITSDKEAKEEAFRAGVVAASGSPYQAPKEAPKNTLEAAKAIVKYYKDTGIIGVPGPASRGYVPAPRPEPAGPTPEQAGRTLYTLPNGEQAALTHPEVAPYLAAYDAREAEWNRQNRVSGMDQTVPRMIARDDLPEAGPLAAPVYRMGSDIDAMNDAQAALAARRAEPLSRAASRKLVLQQRAVTSDMRSKSALVAAASRGRY